MPQLILLHCEGEVAVGCRMMFGCVWLLHLKASKVVVQLLCQGGVTFCCAEVSPVVGEMLDSLPHLPAVVAVQVVLDPPPIIQLGLSDASLQVSSGHTVESPVTTPEGGVLFLQQPPNVIVHPGLLVGIDLSAFVHSDNVYAVLNVTQNTVREHLQVLMFKDIPVSSVETVL